MFRGHVQIQGMVVMYCIALCVWCVLQGLKEYDIQK